MFVFGSGVVIVVFIVALCQLICPDKKYKHVYIITVVTNEHSIEDYYYYDVSLGTVPFSVQQSFFTVLRIAGVPEAFLLLIVRGQVRQTTIITTPLYSYSSL